MKLHLTPQQVRLLEHDAGVFVAAFVATGILDSGHLGWDALASAAVAAAKVTLRKLLPVPPQNDPPTVAPLVPPPPAVSPAKRTGSA